MSRINKDASRLNQDIAAVVHRSKTLNNQRSIGQNKIKINRLQIAENKIHETQIIKAPSTNIVSWQSSAHKQATSPLGDYSSKNLFDEMKDNQNFMGENPDGTWGMTKPKSLWLLFLYAI